MMNYYKKVAMKKTILILFSFFLFSSYSQAQAIKSRSITWAKLNSTGPDLKQIGTIAVRHSRDVKSSSWSVGCETLDRDYHKFSIYKDYVGELGVKHARLQSGWAKCETVKGVYNFAWLDSCVYGLNEQGVKPWICLCYGNPLFGSTVDLGARIGPLVDSEEAMAAWLKYVEATVARYKGVVNEWEIWNEPNGSGSENYAKLFIPTAEVIRKVQKKSVIFGFSLAGIPLDFAKGVFEILKANGKLHLVDVLTYHPYTNNPDSSYPLVEKLREMAFSYNPRIRLYQGENGVHSHLAKLASHPWTEYSQTKWNLRRMTGDLVRGIPSSLFTMVDLRYPNRLQSYGLIRSNLLHELIYKRPLFYAAQHMYAFFDHTVNPVGLLDGQSDSPGKITVAGFRKGKKPVLMVWKGEEIPTDHLQWTPVSLTVGKVKFKDPVYVEMITGKVYDIDNSNCSESSGGFTFRNLPVWDSPVMITERSLVKLRPGN